VAWSARRRLALDRADGGLLGGPGQLAAGRVGLAAIEELTRVLGAATSEEESMIQHGVPEPPFSLSSVDDKDYSITRLSLCQVLLSLFDSATH